MNFNALFILCVVLEQPGSAWGFQATYGSSSAPGDGVSLKSPKKGCPCCDDLTRCPCDGIGAPSWFPTAKPVMVGLAPDRRALRARTLEKPDVPPGKTNQQDTPRSPEDTFPPLTDGPLQPRSLGSDNWFTRATVRVKVAPLRMTINVASGGTFDADRLNTVGSPVTPPTPGGGSGGIPPGPVPGPPPPPPPSTKAESPFGDSDESDGSDLPFLVGPEVAVPLKGDVTEWDAFRWLPGGTTLTLYGHVLVGEMEVFDTSVDVELYGVGLSLAIPLLNADPLGIAFALAAGPGFLKTDLGDTVGAQAATGLQASLQVTPALALVTSVDLVGFIASDARAWGPAAQVGLTISW